MLPEYTWPRRTASTVALTLIAMSTSYAMLVYLQRTGAARDRRHSGQYANSAAQRLVFLSAGHNYYSHVLALITLWILTAAFLQKPVFLRWTLVLWPPAWLACLGFGEPQEYRVLFELPPGSALLAAHTLVTAAGIADHPLFRAAQSGHDSQIRRQETA